MSKANYASLCAKCKHLATSHRLAADASSVDGPYKCGKCDCHMRQSDPVIRVTKTEFEGRVRQGVEW